MVPLQPQNDQFYGPSDDYWRNHKSIWTEGEFH